MPFISEGSRIPKQCHKYQATHHWAGERQTLEALTGIFQVAGVACP